MLFLNLFGNHLSKLAGGTLGLCLLISIAPALAFTSFSVQTSQAKIHTGPGLDYPIAAQLKQGDRLELLAMETEFVQVKVVTTGVTGWLNASEQGWSFQSPDALNKVKEASVKANGKAPGIPSTRALFEGADLAYTNLEELGLTDGHVFEGLHASHAHTFEFPVPRSIKPSQGAVWLHYLASPTLSDYSLIRIDINGQPRQTKTVSLEGRDTWIRIPLTEEDFSSSDHIEVTIRASLVVTASRCFGELLPANFLHILPDTAVTMQLPGRADSVEGGWELLHKKVSLSIPEQMSPAQYSNALVLTMNLMEQGKEVEFVQFPAWGDIMLVSKQELQQLLHETYHATPELQKIYGSPREYLNTGRNLDYLTLPDRAPLVLSEPFGDLPATLTSWQWPRIARQSSYRVYAANIWGDAASIQQHNSMPLKNLGFDMSARFASPKTEWRLDLTPDQLPPNSQLDRLQMSVTSAPSDAGLPPLFYVYLNGVLQQAVRLNNDGKPTRFTVFLGKSDQRTSHNYLRFVAQRSDQIGDCFGPIMGYPVQINPESALVVVDTRMDEPEQFIDLPAYFSGGVELYLPEAILQESTAESLSFLGSLLFHNNYLFDNKQLHFYRDQQPLTLDKPFILMGEANAELGKVAVELEKGRIQVRDFKNNLLLDLEDLGNITVFQIARSSKEYGLWITTPQRHSLPLDAPLNLVNDDVAFADSSGILLTLSTIQRKISAVDYPEYHDWFDLLGKYRFWLMGLAWLLFTMLVVHLYNKATEHKRHKHSDKDAVT